MPANLSVIILNYNTPDYTLALLKMLERERQHLPLQVIVVDNASSDDSVMRIKRATGVDIFIQNERNLGFGTACNHAAKQATAPWFMFLNNDVDLPSGILKKLVNYLEKHHQVGVASLRLKLESGDDQPHAGGLAPTVSAIISRRWDSTLQFNEGACLADWVAGTAMTVPKSVFTEVGGFDEGYFFYFEDADLCRRIKQQGYDIVILDLPIIHYGGKSVMKTRNQKQFYDLGQDRYFSKFGWPGSVWLLRLLRWPYRLLKH